MTILVTGGAGYIGSHVVKLLGERGEEMVILDNLTTGHKEAILYGDLVQMDLSDEVKLSELFKKYQFESVLHFAGSIVVPESIHNPLKYYENNTVNSLRLLKMVEKFKVKHFIFSSTAAVYGFPKGGICFEETPTHPMNPYGESKLMTEQMLQDFSKLGALNFVALRYFNVAGADAGGQIGHSFPQATHLIKMATEAATLKREHVAIYGTDYPTKDGTGVRDYIHVSDLAEAHALALNYLREKGQSQILNCGYSQGYSVREVLSRMQKISGVNFKITEQSRRAGDPAEVIANADKIKKILGFKPRYDDLDVILKTAFHWEKNSKF